MSAPLSAAGTAASGRRSFGQYADGHPGAMRRGVAMSRRRPGVRDTPGAFSIVDSAFSAGEVPSLRYEPFTLKTSSCSRTRSPTLMPTVCPARATSMDWCSCSICDTR